MIYRRFKDKDLSLLGFGMMRLPLNEDKAIDEEQVHEMIKYAMAHGINYYDTAYPYHEGKSEILAGKFLGEYPRDSYYLASKYPGHQHVKGHPSIIFLDQLKKANVEYFDFYLLHNVCENSWDDYCEEGSEIIPYLIKMREEGKIKHLGFSSHAEPKTLEAFLNKWGSEMEFCQIQFNFLDYTLQDAKRKYELLTERGIPVWVMEPLRGGMFGKDASECFRWIERFDNIHMVLSGMSDINQMMENVAIFHADKPLSDLDTNGLRLKAASFTNIVPCTACHYCEGCPKDLEISVLMSLLSQARVGAGLTVPMRLEAMDPLKRPDNCIGCGICKDKCPQNIDIPNMMKELAKRYSEMKKWSEICKEREEAAKKNKAKE